MRRSQVTSDEQLAGYLQYSANALCDARSEAVAPAVAQHILDNPNYHSWGLATVVLTAHLTDKVDGKLAKARSLIQDRLAARGQSITDPDILAAIAIGGKKDEQADKCLTHAVTQAIIAREAANGHIGYACALGIAEGVMAARDNIVARERQKAAGNGIKGDARWLGKIKQTVLAGAQVIAVSPLARPKEPCEGFSVGRVATGLVMVSGAGMSVYSGIDQVRNLRAQQAVSVDTPAESIPTITDPHTLVTGLPETMARSNEQWGYYVVGPNRVPAL